MRDYNLKSVRTNDFRAYLDQELAERSSVDPNYSLRAFARDLGVDSSFLSKLLNGKRSMTARTILTLAPRLSLSEPEILNFTQSANGRRRRYAAGRVEAESMTEMQNFSEVFDWFHMAILVLFDVKTFQGNSTWIGHRLNITEAQAQKAIDDLVEMKMLAKDADGKLQREKFYHTVSSEKFPRVNILKKQILEQAAVMAPQQRGDHSAITLAVSENRVAEAIQRIKKFRRELAQFLHEPHEKDSVYHLAISLFPAMLRID
jgi:uncharacterized protein (TIGR02147 family)